MFSSLIQRFSHSTWRAKAGEKVELTDHSIPQEWRLDEATLRNARQRKDVTGDFIANMLTQSERNITSWSATVIAANVKEKRCSAAEVTKAFCHRAAIGHQLVNCMHEIFFDVALRRARELDAYQEQFGDVVGPLHGVPVSLKDQFHVKNVETTMGYVGWINTFEGDNASSKYKTQESLIVEQLMAVGAVLYCKTSLPQALLLGETHNNLIGRTSNPLSQKLSCGGSSGGEGALLALGGSCLGIGTDIGGSVRIPAAFCGVYSIKPSHDRFSYKDVANINPGQTTIESSIGFMSTTLVSLRLIQTALLSTAPWISDPEVVPIPWRQEQEFIENDLCFGIFYDDDYCRLHPPIERGIRMVKKALLAKGHKVMKWAPPSHREGSHLHNQFMRCDGGNNIWQQLHLSGEPLIKELSMIFGTGPKSPLPLLEFQTLVLRRREYRQKYARYWNSTLQSTNTGRPVDAVIMAVAPHAAVIPGNYYHYDYSDIVNVLDYTSVAIPVAKADMKIDIADPNYNPLNKIDKLNWDAYDPVLYDGAPIGVQVVAQRLQEERCLCLAEIVDQALKATVDSQA